MARPVTSVHLLTTAPRGAEAHPDAALAFDQLTALAAIDRFGNHALVDDPAGADLLLFAESPYGAGHYFERVRRDPVFRRFRSKSYVYCAADRVVPLLPGVYTSLERRMYRRGWTRSGPYLGILEEGPLAYDPDARPSLLFTFVGSSRSHPARQRVVALSHPDALIADTSSEAQPPADRRERYAETLKASAFVLCPRGGGTASFRMFEAMLLGRAPVVISDQWVPPEGPDWDSFSIRVAERDVASIPALLESRAGEAAAMGAAARAAWLDWFAQPVLFHRIVEWCLDLAPFAPEREGLRRLAPYRHMLRPFHAARAVVKRPPRG